MSIEFLITSLIVVLIPGTGVIYTIAIALGRGFGANVAAAIGCTFGIVPAALASILGLSAILHTSALAFQVIKYLGVIYLFYMAWNMAKTGGAFDVKNDSAQTNLLKIAVAGTAINVLNPKLPLFFLAFLPQFIDSQAGQVTSQLLSLAFDFMMMTFIVFVIYGACASLARDYVLQRPIVVKWLRRSFAGMFGLLGLKLALSEA